MAIKVRHGTVESIAKLGLLAGQSQAAQREIERTQALAQRAQQQEYERQMTELRARLDIEAAMRSQQWEVEKMEIRSRLDFEREEKERMRRLDNIDSALQQIDREVESGRITEPQANALRFRQEMKKYGTTPPVSLIQPPKEEKPKYPTTSERMRAYGFLQKEELREPSWLPKLAHEVTFGALGKAPLTEEEKFYREMFEKTAKGIPLGTTPGIPAGTISQGLSEPKTQQEYNAIPVGTQYIDSTGNIRTKS